MKALLIITLVSGLHVSPAVMSNMDNCLEAATPLTKQTQVTSATCVPYSPVNKLDSFRQMMDMFLELIDSIENKKMDDNWFGDSWRKPAGLGNTINEYINKLSMVELSEGKANDEVGDKEENKCGPKEWLTGVKCPDIGRTDNFLTRPSPR